MTVTINEFDRKHGYYSGSLKTWAETMASTTPSGYDSAAVTVGWTEYDGGDRWMVERSFLKYDPATYDVSGAGTFSVFMKVISKTIHATWASEIKAGLYRMDNEVQDVPWHNWRSYGTNGELVSNEITLNNYNINDWVEFVILPSKFSILEVENYISFTLASNKDAAMTQPTQSGVGGYTYATMGFELLVSYASAAGSSDDKRVGSIRHIYRPGVYKAEITLGGLSSGIDIPDLYVPSGKLSSLTEKKEDTVPEKPAPIIPPSVQANIIAAIEADNFTERLIKQTQKLPGGSIVQGITNYVVNPIKSVWNKLFGGQ